MSMGAPRISTQGRGDTTGVFSDTLSWLHGAPSLKFGGRVPAFYNDVTALDTGALRFADAAHFIWVMPIVFRLRKQRIG